MAKPVLSKFVRFDRFSLGRHFAVQTVSKETVQALYFCFGASKAGRFKINNQNSEKK